MGGRGGSSIIEKNTSEKGLRNRAEELHKIMKDSGLPVVKSISETMNILRKNDRKNGLTDYSKKEIESLKRQAVSQDLKFKLKSYTDKDLKDGIATAKDGMRFNNEQMKNNIGKSRYSQTNMNLYERNKQLETDIKNMQAEQKRRKKK